MSEYPNCTMKALEQKFVDEIMQLDKQKKDRLRQFDAEMTNHRRMIQMEWEEKGDKLTDNQRFRRAELEKTILERHRNADSRRLDSERKKKYAELRAYEEQQKQHQQKQQHQQSPSNPCTDGPGWWHDRDD